MSDSSSPNRHSTNPISSEDLAAIIVDALCDAEIVQKGDVRRALEITADKIDGRKEIGDY